MTLLAPERLALLVVPVLLLALYLALQRRRRRYAVRFAAVELLDGVAPERPGWRRHLPALVYLVAIGVLVVGIAPPGDGGRDARPADDRSSPSTPPTR